VEIGLANRDRVWLAIHNAGDVPEALRDRLFEKYATSGKAGGTGLGAYSARLIVENLGGTIACLSGEGQGTTLFFDLVPTGLPPATPGVTFHAFPPMVVGVASGRDTPKCRPEVPCATP